MTEKPGMTRKSASVQTKQVEDRQVRVIISTANEDRMGDIVVQEGIDLTAYMQNPVVLMSHNWDMPIARALSVEQEGNQLVALVQFPPAGQLAASDTVYAQIKNGLINAASIGFMPKEWTIEDDGAFRFLESELYEFSFVAVPANREALILERAAKRPDGSIVLNQDDQQDLLARNLAAIREDLAAIRKDVEEEQLSELAGSDVVRYEEPVVDLQVDARAIASSVPKTETFQIVKKIDLSEPVADESDPQMDHQPILGAPPQIKARLRVLKLRAAG